MGVTDRGYWAGFVSPTKLTVWGEGAKILIGDRTVLNGVCISSRHLVEIGHECLFATGIQIMDSDTHRIASRNRIWDLDTPQPVKIGHNVWVGLNAIILKGTIIGDNCVVGAGSVVKGVFPDNCVIAGNPARIVKRFVIND